MCTSEGTLSRDQEVLLSDIHSISFHSWPAVLSALNKGNLTLGDIREKLTKEWEPVSWRAYGRYVISVSKRIRGRKKKKKLLLYHLSGLPSLAKRLAENRIKLTSRC